MENEEISLESRIAPDRVEFVKLTTEEEKKNYRERQREYLENLKEFVKRDLKEADDESEEKIK